MTFERDGSAQRAGLEGGCPYLGHVGGPASAARVSTVPRGLAVRDLEGMTTATRDPEGAQIPAVPALAAPPRRGRRERLARAERPLLLAGLALVAAHLLDLAFSGPHASAFGGGAVLPP